VSASVDGAEIWIRVRDSGPGMEPEEQERIFTPFYRGPAGRRFPQGMGLGLSIARDLVTAHGGRIEVQSTPGVGSTFTIWLPC
jgi:signal transduction histidine kinase